MSSFFIIGTNVVVAGLRTAHADSPVARILDGMLSAAFPFFVPEALLAEYRAVLVRPKLCKLYGPSGTEVDTILAEMIRHAIVLAPVSPEVKPKAPDPGDRFFGGCSQPAPVRCWRLAINGCCKTGLCCSGLSCRKRF
ncbi:MAG: hypothetical protein H7238_08605 [Polaromonas sp.]|nr:hypothetical protein [Polaromonas sp.]